MTIKPNNPLAGALAVVVGGLALVGWAFDIAILKSLHPSWVSMKPNTALAFVLMGSALLWFPQREPSTGLGRPSWAFFCSNACALLAGLIGLLTLGEYAFGWNPGLDQWLFKEPAGAVGTSNPGRMAPDTALSFLILAVPWLTGAWRNRRRILIVSVIAGSLVTTLALVEILSYFTPVLRTYGWGGLTMMAFPTATLFAVMGLAIISGSWREALSPRLAEFSNYLWWLASCLATLAISFALYVRAEKQIDRANERRLQSMLMAEELRQTEDDLTRMARTYVVTGDPAYKRHFQDILDIRDGMKPRPEHFGRPYWDLVLGDGPAPRGNEQAIPLLESMRRVGLTSEESRLLARAKTYSDRMALLASEAMRLVEPAGPGVKVDRTTAVMMLHDARYHQTKADASRLILDFLGQVDKRTLADVHRAENTATIFRYVIGMFGFVLVYVLWRTYRTLADTLGGTVDEVYKQIASIGTGDFSKPIQVKAGLENSVLGWLSETRDKLKSSVQERQQAEAAMRASEQHFRNVADFTHEWEYWTAPDGSLTWMSPSCERVTGYPVEDFQQDPGLISQICHPEDRDLLVDHVHEITGHQGLAPMDFRIRHRDGRQIWISHVCVPVWDSEGRPAGRRATNVEITERKQSELKLQESEQRFRTIFDRAIDGIVIFSIEGEIIDVNDAFASMHGRTREEMRGMHLSELDVAESAGLAPERMRRLLAGETLCVELEQLHQDGHVFLTEATGSLITLGELPVILSFHRDISGRKQAEEALQHERTLKAAIVDSTDDAIITKLLDGTVTSWNQAAEKLLGYSAEEMVGQSVRTIIPSDRYAEEEEVLDRTRNGEQIKHYQTVRKAKDGHLVPISLTISPIRDKDGRIIGASKIARDITEIKEMEQAIQTLNRDLEHRVEIRTKQLEAAIQELGAFTYSVSHDLRAPLRHLTGFVELLNRQSNSGLDAKSRHYLEVISQSATKMGCLIDDLLSFSRMGRAEMMKNTVDLGRLTQEVREELSRDLPPGRGLHWRIGELPVVTGDQAMLRLVLVNLLSNAVKYSRHAEAPVIEVGAWLSEGREWTVCVRDNGAGFEMKYVDKLFGLFQRLHSSTEYEGTGVGLANVQRIIARHGGRTWAEGELNKGAAFYFTLPLQKEA